MGTARTNAKKSMYRISICESQQHPFFEADGDWWQKVEHLPQQATTVVVELQWAEGMIYYELFFYGETLNSYLYCEQLDRLKGAITQKRPVLPNRRGIALHQARHIYR